MHLGKKHFHVFLYKQFHFILISGNVIIVLLQKKTKTQKIWEIFLRLREFRFFQDPQLVTSRTQASCFPVSLNSDWFT